MKEKRQEALPEAMKARLKRVNSWVEIYFLRNY
jgi:hypothetical protein